MTIQPPQQFPRRCACGRLHTERDWNRLPLRGYFVSDTEVEQLRACPCGAETRVVMSVFEPGAGEQLATWAQRVGDAAEAEVEEDAKEKDREMREDRAQALLKGEW